MPRYVILEHDHPGLHWDLMLEEGHRLRTWRLTAFPEPGRHVVAVCIHYHRVAYLDYEGPVNGNRGKVIRRDAGTYSVQAETDSSLVLLFQGKKIQGELCLTRLDGDDWQLEWRT